MIESIRGLVYHAVVFTKRRLVWFVLPLFPMHRRMDVAECLTALDTLINWLFVPSLFVVLTESATMDEDGHPQHRFIGQILKRSNHRWIRPRYLGRGTFVGEVARSARTFKRRSQVKNSPSPLFLHPHSSSFSLLILYLKKKKFVEMCLMSVRLDDDKEKEKEKKLPKKKKEWW